MILQNQPLTTHHYNSIRTPEPMDSEHTEYHHVNCPYCDFTAKDERIIRLHITMSTDTTHDIDYVFMPELKLTAKDKHNTTITKLPGNPKQQYTAKEIPVEKHWNTTQTETHIINTTLKHFNKSIKDIYKHTNKTLKNNNLNTISYQKTYNTIINSFNLKQATRKTQNTTDNTSNKLKPMTNNSNTNTYESSTQTHPLKALPTTQTEQDNNTSNTQTEQDNNTSNTQTEQDNNTSNTQTTITTKYGEHTIPKDLATKYNALTTKQQAMILELATETDPENPSRTLTQLSNDADVHKTYASNIKNDTTKFKIAQQLNTHITTPQPVNEAQDLHSKTPTHSHNHNTADDTTHNQLQTLTNELHRIHTLSTKELNNGLKTEPTYTKKALTEHLLELLNNTE